MATTSRPDDEDDPMDIDVAADEESPMNQQLHSDDEEEDEEHDDADGTSTSEDDEKDDNDDDGSSTSDESEKDDDEDDSDNDDEEDTEDEDDDTSSEGEPNVVAAKKPKKKHPSLPPPPSLSRHPPKMRIKLSLKLPTKANAPQRTLVKKPLAGSNSEATAVAQNQSDDDDEDESDDDSAVKATVVDSDEDDDVSVGGTAAAVVVTTAEPILATAVSTAKPKTSKASTSSKPKVKHKKSLPTSKTAKKSLPTAASGSSSTNKQDNKKKTKAKTATTANKPAKKKTTARSSTTTTTKRRSVHPSRPIKMPPMHSPGMLMPIPSQTGGKGSSNTNAATTSGSHTGTTSSSSSHFRLMRCGNNKYTTPASVFDHSMASAGYSVQQRTARPHRGSSVTRTVGDMFDSNVALALHFPPLVPREFLKHVHGGSSSSSNDINKEDEEGDDDAVAAVCVDLPKLLIDSLEKDADDDKEGEMDHDPMDLEEEGEEDDDVMDEDTNGQTTKTKRNGHLRSASRKRRRPWAFKDMVPVSLTMAFPSDYVEKRLHYVDLVQAREQAIVKQQEAEEQDETALGDHNKKPPTQQQTQDMSLGTGAVAANGTTTTTGTPTSAAATVPPIPEPPGPPMLSECDGWESNRLSQDTSKHPLYIPKGRDDFVAHLDPDTFHITDGRYFGLLTNWIADPNFVGANAPGIAGVNASGGAGLATSSTTTSAGSTTASTALSPVAAAAAASSSSFSNPDAIASSSGAAKEPVYLAMSAGRTNPSSTFATYASRIVAAEDVEEEQKQEDVQAQADGAKEAQDATSNGNLLKDGLVSTGDDGAADGNGPGKIGQQQQAQPPLKPVATATATTMTATALGPKPNASLSDLKQLFAIAGPDRQTELRQSIVRAAVRAARSGRHQQSLVLNHNVQAMAAAAEKSSNWMTTTADQNTGTIYPSVMQAFAALSGIQPCERCKNNKRGPYHCRLRRRHKDPDFDGGKSHEQLEHLFSIAMDQLVA